MAFLGLDLSLTSTGIVILSKSGALLHSSAYGYGLKKAGTDDEIKRLLDITNRIESVVSEFPIECVGIEDYAYRRAGSGSQITRQAELTGVVKTTLYQYRLKIFVVGISQGRKITFECPVGVSNAERKEGMDIKTKVMELVKTKYGLDFETTDEADAFVLAEAVRKLIVPGNPSPEALKELQKLERRQKGAPIIKKGGKRGK